MLTSSNEIIDRTTAYDKGANSYLQKPNSFLDFKDVVEQVCSYWAALNAPAPQAGKYSG